MHRARTQAQAIRAVRDGFAVDYRGYEIPVAPESERANDHRARAWVLDHTGPLRRGPVGTGDTRITVTLLDDQVAAIDRRAETQGVSRAQVVRDLLTEALG